MTGAATDDVVIKLISYGEERGRRDAEQGVIYDPPFRCVTGLHWKGAALKWNGISRMSLGVVHVHVQAFSRGVDLVIKRSGIRSAPARRKGRTGFARIGSDANRK